MTMSTLRRACAAGAALTVFVSACSSDPVVADEEVDEALERPYADAEQTPLEEELGGGDVLSDTADDALDLCMEAAGFEGFGDADADGLAADTDPDTDGTDSPEESPSVEEYAEQWGYGISTVLAEDGSRREDAPVIAAAGDTETEGWADYRAALDPERQAAFDVALYGDDTTTGCVAEALSTTGGSVDDQRELDQLLRDLYGSIDDDPETEAAADRYATCMDEAGYPDIDTPSDALGEVGRRTDQVFGAASMDPSLEVDPESLGQSPVPGLDDAAVDPDAAPIETTPVTVGQLEAGALEELQAFERELAVAELPCRVRYEIEITALTERYEAEFVEEHRELLDRVG